MSKVALRGVVRITAGGCEMSLPDETRLWASRTLLGMELPHGFFSERVNQDPHQLCNTTSP